MITVCFECGAVKADDGRPDGRVSHGICQDCLPRVRDRWETEITEAQPPEEIRFLREENRQLGEMLIKHADRALKFRRRLLELEEAARQAALAQSPGEIRLGLLRLRELLEADSAERCSRCGVELDLRRGGFGRNSQGALLCIDCSIQSF